MPTQAAVDNYVQQLRDARGTAETTFDTASSADIHVYPSNQVNVTLTFDPAADTQTDRNAAEQAATDAADELRGFGADYVNSRSDNGSVELVAVFIP